MFQAVRSPVHDPELLLPSGQLPPELATGTNLNRGLHHLFADCGICLKLHTTYRLLGFYFKADI